LDLGLAHDRQGAYDRNRHRDCRRAEARAAARGLTLSEFFADLAGAAQILSPALQAMNTAGEGPWAPKVLAEDARRLAEFERTREGVPWDEVKNWMQSWGTPNELPAPKPRKL
jgi:predicted transcriptional regulator